MPATLVLVNPRAGRFARDPGALGRVQAAAAGAPVVVAHAAADLDRLAPRLAAAERLVVCGGDGTFAAVLSALGRAGLVAPPLVLAPAGTVDTTARALGQRVPLLAAVRAGVAAPALREVAHPTLALRTEDTLHVGLTFGTGLVARFFEAYLAGADRGLARAARLALGTVAGAALGTPAAAALLAPMPGTLTVEGARVPGAAWSLVISSVLPDVGLGIRVVGRAAADPTRPHLVAFAATPRQMVRAVPRVLGGRPLGLPDMVDALVTEAALDFGPGGGPWVLDGDLLRSRQVHLSAGPSLRRLVIDAG